jgi:GT2 family glycosyltransferase
VHTIYVVDNGSDDRLKGFVQDLSEKIIYIQGQGNVGYGTANNIAIRAAVQQGAKYHLVLNPDIEFEEGTLEKLTAFMDENPNVGLVQPKALYPNGNIQYLCKLLPAPADLIFRRFLPHSSANNKRSKQYELQDIDRSSVRFDIPFLSGCFLFLRIDTLKRMDLFDERFFLYMEDVDLCRRMQDIAHTAFFPFATVVHRYEKGSYKNSTLLWCHIMSTFKYFNKWGWFFDKKRVQINNRILEKTNFAKS